MFLSLLLSLPTGCGDGTDNGTDGRLLTGAPSILVDLDPNSTAMTFTVENITANPQGQLYFSDRESGNILRVDPAAPTPVVVGKIEDRTDPATNMPQKANGGGLVFTAAGDLLIAAGPFGEVVRLTASELNAANPGSASAFVTGVQGANAVLLDGDNLYVSGGNTGNLYRAPASGGVAELWAQIAPNTRSVPPDNFMQSVVSNGLAIDASGALLVADTARGAIWKITKNSDGNAGTPETLIQSPLLYGVDGITFDPQGRLWAAVNERNALVVVHDGQAEDAHKNDNAGPLEFPAAVVFVGNVGYVPNYDRPRADNLAVDGMTSSAGIGSSIVKFSL